MSIYDKSSLVLIPSGTKTGKVFSQKPVSGDGDFTFTRASAATRVNADGNIEKETGNLFTYSNDLSNAIWQLGLITATSGQAGYDGSSDAWLITKDAAAYRAIEHDINNSGVYTYSVYAKANTLNLISLRDQTLGQGAGFNLTNGTTYGNSGVSSSIDSVGGGWYRCSVTFNGSSTRLAIYIDFDNATAGSVFVQDFQLEQGLVARDVITTTTTALYGGITDNTPRLDYTDSSCPALLLEPQRTNYVRSSEYYDTSANWILSNGVSVEDNFTISPEGVQNASKVTLSAGISAFLYTSLSGMGIPAGDVIISCWAKADSAITIGMNDGTVNPNSIDLTTEWKRFEFNFTWTGSGGFQVDNYFGVSPSNQEKVFYLWGVQAEAGSYATSYIPTYGSSVSRVADSCSKTGVSSLIGQTEGTFYAEIDWDGRDADAMFMTLSNGTTNNRMHIGYDESGNRFYFNIRENNLQQSLIVLNNPSTGIKKIAAAYKQNDCALYINGVQIGISTSTAVAPTSRIDIGNYYSAGFEYPVKQNLLFKTRLSNQELQDLTTL